LRTWIEYQHEISRIAGLQLFFVGGAPRSGTTWLQQILNAHPDVSCHGEGLFQQELASPLERLMARRRQALEAKNTQLFRHTGGYPLPAGEEVDCLLGTAILLALHRQSAGKACRAVGEKTPENVFLFPRLQRLFPHARFIGIARDPRDVLTSAWHFFRRTAVGKDEAAEKMGFIRVALPAMVKSAHIMLAMRKSAPDHCRIVTYETLIRDPSPTMAGLFRFLGVSDAEDVVAACVDRASFANQAGRAAGTEQNGSFLRKGIVGDWVSTLTPEMNAMILEQLGWSFPHFGWQP
jgi:hypothetical protein